tara:strand:+ start:190 stop:498 length:309 start_codon:yes stop_codon:yes gene_type:complete
LLAVRLGSPDRQRLPIIAFRENCVPCAELMRCAICEQDNPLDQSSRSIPIVASFQLIAHPPAGRLRGEIETQSASLGRQQALGLLSAVIPPPPIESVLCRAA